MFKKIIISVLIVALIPVTVYLFFPGVVVDIAIFFERNAAGLDVKSVQVDDHNIFYMEGGRGETLLLLHGYGQNKENWNRLAKYMTSNYHVVCIDLPGFGESSKIESKKYGIKEQTKRLDQFCEKLQLNKFHLAGSK